MMMVFGIVVAGGSGTRMGFPKQYARLANQPMWLRSIRALQAGGIHECWLVAPQVDVSTLEQACVTGQMERPIRVIAGGTTRAQSVKNGVDDVLAEAATRGLTPSNVLVAIHDAARPFVSPSDVAAAVQAGMTYGAVLLGQPCVDTMKRVIAGQVQETVPREDLWHAQTPQVFRGDWLQQAYGLVKVLQEMTDEATMLEKLGYPLHIVAATEYNAKVTTQSDLEIAYWLAERRWGSANSE